jgi:hypothetical protein
VSDYAERNQRITDLRERMNDAMGDDAQPLEQVVVVKCDDCGVKLWLEADDGIDIGELFARATVGWLMDHGRDTCPLCRRAG